MTRKSYVLDASALLCLLNREPGAESVGALMGGAKISAVNLTEVISKLIDKGLDGPTVVCDLSELDLIVVDMDRRQAERAGLLRLETRGHGLSLGDRACLALAHDSGAVALTGDRAWATLSLDLHIAAIDERRLTIRRHSMTHLLLRATPRHQRGLGVGWQPSWR